MKKLIALAGIVIVLSLNACGSYEDCRGVYSEQDMPAAQTEIPG